MPLVGTRSARALGEVQPRVLAGELRRLPLVLLRASASPSRTRPSRSRTASAGGGRPRRAVLVAESHAAVAGRGHARGLVRAHHEPVAADPRRRRPDQPGAPQRAARRADRRRAGDARRRRAHPARPRSGEGEPAHPRLRRPVPRRADPRRRTWSRWDHRRKRVLYLSLADRPRPRPPRRGHRRRAARAPSGRADRLARPASGDAGARGGRRARAPGQPVAGQRVRAHRGRGRRARPALLRGAAPDGRGAAGELHGLPRRRAGDAVRPRGRRRGLGRRPLPAREPGAQTVRVRVAHRLRRLPADARRRRRARRWSRPTTTPR